MRDTDTSTGRSPPTSAGRWRSTCRLGARLRTEEEAHAGVQHQAVGADADGGERGFPLGGERLQFGQQSVALAFLPLGPRPGIARIHDHEPHRGRCLRRRGEGTPRCGKPCTSLSQCTPRPDIARITSGLQVSMLIVAPLANSGPHHRFETTDLLRRRHVLGIGMRRLSTEVEHVGAGREQVLGVRQRRRRCEPAATVGERIAGDVDDAEAAHHGRSIATRGRTAPTEDRRASQRDQCPRKQDSQRPHGSAPPS